MKQGPLSLLPLLITRRHETASITDTLRGDKATQPGCCYRLAQRSLPATHASSHNPPREFIRTRYGRWILPSYTNPHFLIRARADFPSLNFPSLNEHYYVLRKMYA
jgi:hypothetical protein